MFAHMKVVKGVSLVLIAGVCVSLSAVSMAHAAQDPALKLGLVPHKALYELSLTSKRPGVNISNISGQVSYQWQPSCDAWVTTHQFNTQYEYIEMPPVQVQSEYSTYEAFDGQAYSFTSQKKRGEVTFEEIRGNVKSESDGSALEAVYSMPPDLTQDLPKGTLFPVAHTLDVLGHIKDGTRFYKAVLFDGSDDTGPVTVNTFIGKRVDVSAEYKESEHIDQSIVQAPAYKIRLAFFPMSPPSDVAEYEMSVIFHENGLVSAINIDYADFSLAQNLIALEEMKTTCAE